ncbi:MAG: GHMP kinase [Bacteroidales bacterium]|nr:GHMP kinase [Bacteroidales bacterium]
MAPHYYKSNGKLLISGEYLVMHGAVAFAIPVRFGQSLEVLESDAESVLRWETYVEENSWFKAEYELPGLGIANHNNSKSAAFVHEVLLAAQGVNLDFLNGSGGLQVDCRIDFNMEWGLGSSSSLISNIAYWAGIDPFMLHEKVSNGSGYDIACARLNKPILYENSNGTKKIITVEFQPKFLKNLYFIYLGKKKDSQADVKLFKNDKRDFIVEVKQISDISRKMASSNNYEEFGKLMRDHEEILTSVLGRPSLKETNFNDFDGEIKSLGAWGGDFAMALWPHESEELKMYLATKNLGVYFGYNEMIYKTDEQA